MDYIERKRWIISIILGMLFVLFSLSIGYSFTAKSIAVLGGRITMINDCGRPSIALVLLHAVLFIVIVRVVIY